MRASESQIISGTHQKMRKRHDHGGRGDDDMSAAKKPMATHRKRAVLTAEQKESRKRMKMARMEGLSNAVTPVVPVDKSDDAVCEDSDAKKPVFQTPSRACSCARPPGRRRAEHIQCHALLESNERTQQGLLLEVSEEARVRAKFFKAAFGEELPKPCEHGGSSCSEFDRFVKERDVHSTDSISILAYLSGKASQCASNAASKRASLLREVFGDDAARHALDGPDVSWLAREALHKEKITRDEAIDTYKAHDVTTVKLYLRSMVDDKRILDAIEDFVCTASRVFSAGSIVLNDFLARSFDNSGQSFTDDFVDGVLDQSIMSYIILPMKKDLATHKEQCDNPKAIAEYWERMKVKLLPLYPPDAGLRRFCWQQQLTFMTHQLAAAFRNHVLVHFERRFSDHVLHRIQSELGFKEGTVKVNGRDRPVFRLDGLHVFKCRVVNMIKTGDVTLPWSDDEEVERDQLPQQIVDFILAQRKEAGLDAGMELCNMKKLTGKLLTKHVLISRFIEQLHEQEAAKDAAWEAARQQAPEASMEATRPGRLKLPAMFSIAPISKFGRKFCRIDAEVMRTIAAASGVAGASLESVFNIEPARWKETRKRARRTKRQKRRASPKCKRHRAASGRGCIKKHARIDSVATDGVAVSICMKHVPPPQSRDGDKPPSERAPSTSCLTPCLIAYDPGRVNIFQSAAPNPEDRATFVTTRLTDMAYKKGSLVFKHRDQWMPKFKEGKRELVQAIDEMSRHTWRTSHPEKLQSMVETVVRHIEQLERHHIRDDTFARWRMLMWRRKVSVATRAVLDSVYSAAPRCRRRSTKREQDKLHTPTKRERDEFRKTTFVTLAVGDAKVVSTDRKGRCGGRHGGVPTSWIWKVADRALRSQGFKFQFRREDEFRSTMCCHRCHKVMEKVFDQEGQEDRGVRLCINPACARECSTLAHHVNGRKLKIPYESFKLRNRDLNAAINIWKCADREMRGLERPEALCRGSKKAVKRPAKSSSSRPAKRSSS